MIVTVALLIMAASCSLFEKKVHTPQTFELRINRPASAAVHFSVLKDVDTNTETLQAYADQLNPLTVSSITYTIKNYSGTGDAVVSGDIAFAQAGSDDFTVLDTFTDLPLRKMEESGQEKTTVLYQSASRKKLAQLLQRGSLITFRLNATAADSSPVTASLLVTIDTERMLAI